MGEYPSRIEAVSVALRFSVDDFDRLVESGFFIGPEKRRVELVNGELREMAPIGPFHADVVTRLQEWSEAHKPTTVRVRVQQSLRIIAWDSQPEPDIAWVKRKSYRDGHPTPADVLLLIEVADSSLYEDRREKMILYARAGIPEYWIVNIPDLQFEILRGPSDSGYTERQVLKIGDHAASLAFPDLQIPVAEAFGP